jgi:molecular chaperone DnaK
MCFQLEKLMKEQADKIKPTDKAPLEAAITKTREVAKGSNVEAIKAAIAELEQASHAMSKSLYEGSTPAGAAGSSSTSGSGENGGPKPSGDEDAIDAEFEVKE